MTTCGIADKISASPLALEAQLGCTYRKNESSFAVWAPTLDELKLCLYKGADDTEALEISMNKEEDIFRVTLTGDFEGFYYSYKIKDREVTDPYSKAVSMNSRRTAIVDMADTDPPGFRDSYFTGKPMKDAVIYEVHVGDFSFDDSSDSSFPGKYLAFSEIGTNFHGYSTCLDHLKKLGISHVHLMPVADFITVDENPSAFGHDNNYNWGYDPELFNVPEGSYSRDPHDPKSRIRELKCLVKSLHEAGIGVIMDVVYNHTYKTFDSNFNSLVPNYYYRQRGGIFTNGSGCGNEMASEKAMVRKFIIESLLYWQREYKIDGFRFDLMALMDIETVSLAYKALKANNPNLIFYGEPWTGSESVLPWDWRTIWQRQNNEGFALFNERFRNAIKGDNNGYSRGYIQGISEYKHEIESGLLGSINYKGIRDGGAKNPIQSINYFNAHDNLILEDKLSKSLGDDKLNDSMTKLAFGVLLTAQGVPFFHAGNEFRRSKHMDNNSYCSPFYINAIDWGEKQENYEVYRYVRDLIALRKEYPTFRLETKDEVESRIELLDTEHPDVICTMHRLEKEGSVLLCFYHNGWKNVSLKDDFIFKSLDCMRIEVQKIFDNNGRVEVNRVNLSRENKVQVHLEPLSLTIFKIKKMEYDSDM